MSRLSVPISNPTPARRQVYAQIKKTSQRAEHFCGHRRPRPAPQVVLFADATLAAGP